MIGSRRKVAGVFGQLQAEGVSKERIHRVHAPIGLDIGAEMPAEIAISILAEITQQRRRGGGHLPSMSGATAAEPQPVRGSDESMDFWQQVAAWRNRGPVALATIVAAEGSTPRGPGARMALAENERLGSVGGGPGEVEVERLARQALSDGRPRRLRLDLHEEPSPGLGATCGGTVVVFIERLGHLHRAG
jgi:xanthine dehydrogenase accessory factor